MSSFEKRLEQAKSFRWRDLRAAGPLGILFAAAWLATGVLGLYDWVVRRVGCTNPEAHDPQYYCPSNAHVISVALILAIGLFPPGVLGFWAILTGRKRLLAAALVIQLAALGALVWIAQEPSFHVHLR